MLLLRPERFYCALAVSATIRIILTKIWNRSGIAVQWNVGFKVELHTSHTILYRRGVDGTDASDGTDPSDEADASAIILIYLQGFSTD